VWPGPSQGSMSIVILGWGSLCYDWHGLSLVEPVRWRLAGLNLPIEFSRRSQQGRRRDLLTAVIDPACPENVPVRLSVTTYTTIAAAREQLRIRENKTRFEWIGSVDRNAAVIGEVSSKLQHQIHDWLLATPHEAVAWTAIPPDFGGQQFTIAAAVRHFRDLDPSKQQDAREYIAWAPDEVETPLRQALRDGGLLEGARPRPIDIATFWPD
jgi:hypothetical protein